tara:strand:- start:375 stop:1148 length:774 start_codon:yes stop_codon:yes gene_type:complete
MEAVDFKVVLKQVAALAGIDQDAIPNSFFIQVRDFADLRVSHAWDRAEWPEAIRYDSPTVSTSGNINKFTYPTGADVILNVFSDDPRTSTTIKSYSYTLTDTGSAREVILPEADTSVTVEYKESPPAFIGDVHLTASKTYAAGEQAYYNGNFYSANSGVGTCGAGGHSTESACTGAGETWTPGPTGAWSAAEWTLVKVPKFLQGYLVRSCYSDYMRSNGQTQEAAIEDNIAEGLLFREVEKLTRQQGQTRRVEMGVY